ncbi:MAG: hypothetical protein EKK48_18945 [Candidatus Melainabacteria bacterium]|nr:MAG: hypothetical protein EKK48_18945 [Candidatus Melainabacteria bacterium]
MTHTDRPENSETRSSESTPSSLWKSAYEHKEAIGLGAAAVAATALHLKRKGTEVLVVEAAPFMGKAMRDSLESAGHKVTWITEINTLKPLVGITEGKEKLLLNPRRFGTAFIDPNHVSPDSVDFEHVAPFFQKERIRTIGTSAMSAVNKDMLASGFDLAGNKTAVLTSIVGRRLDLQQIGRAPAEAQSILSNLETRINSQELADARSQARKLIAKYAVQ